MVEAVVEFDYKAQEPDELTLRKGDVITEIKTQPGGWWEGTLARTGKRGMFPDNFVKMVESSNTRTDVMLRTTPGRRCKVLFSYQPANEDELELQVNDIIDVMAEVEEGWWKGKLRNRIGVFPSNFVVELFDEPSEPKDGTYRKSSRSSLDENMKAVNSMNHEDALSSQHSSSMLNLPASSSGDSDVPTLPPKPVKEMCKVLYAYDAVNDDELTIREGDIITLLSRDGQDKGWWKGELRGKVGVFPDNFVQIIPYDESTKPARPPLKGNTVTTNRIRDSITKPPTSTQQQPTEKSVQRKSLELPPKPEDKLSPPGVSKKPVLPPPPLKKPQRSPSSSLSKSLATSPSNITADPKQANVTTPTKPPDSPTAVAGARLPLTTLTASIKQLTVTESASSSTSTSISATSTEQTVQSNKPPTGPKHSDSIDSMDGLCLSRNSGSYSVSNHTVANSEAEPAVNSVDTDFDSVGRTAMLTHPTASRVRAPRRRPPSTISTRESQEIMGLLNGNAELHVQHNDNDKTNKVPWVEELKLNQAKKNSAIAQGRTRVMIGATGGGSSESPPISPEPPPPATKISPSLLSSNVTLRSQTTSGGPRPQSMFGGDRSAVRGFGLIPTSPSDNVTISAKQWADLNEKVTKLEATLETQRETFLKAIKELTNKLNEETERRLQMQLEIEKLTDLVTQV